MLKAKTDLTAEYVRERFIYEPESGAFLWRKNNKPAGTITRNGRLRVCLYKHGAYLAHRLIWLYMTGSWPAQEIDHINRNPLDNRFSNLREATRHENARNYSMRRDNKSGHKGVSWMKPNNCWIVRIKFNNVERFIGHFDDKNEAGEAYKRASLELHKEFSAFASIQ